MIFDLRNIVLFIHILLAVIWFGSVLFIGWGVFPTSNKLKPTDQRQFLINLMKWVHWPLTLTGLSVIITGIILGTYLGPLKNWNIIISTLYGHIFLTALIIAIFILFWGVFISYKHSINIFSKIEIWTQAENGNYRPLQKAFISIAAVESVEIFGFFIILICMVLI